ncbi:MAG: hypothetical protein AB7V36_04625 [Bacteroidales bacterium]
MEEVFQIIFEFVVAIVLQYPGAFIRWIFARKKKKFDDLLKDDLWINAGVTVVFVLIIVGLITVLVSI